MMQIISNESLLVTLIALDIISLHVSNASSISPYAMQIMLGEHDLRAFEGTEQLAKTDTIIWHPEWVIFHPSICIIFQLTDLLTHWQKQQINSHPQYFSICSYDYQTLDYDIMLIKLFNPVKVTETVSPISLPTGCTYGGMPCSVSGWGKTAAGDDGELPTMIRGGVL